MFLQRLRSRTANQHSLLEQNTASKNLLSPQVTAADYATYLSLLYGFVKGFENIIFPLLQHSITDIEERRKTHLLIADLNMLGIDEAGIAVIPDQFFAEVYHSNATALGGMYVLEGSVLGGAVVYKHLKTTLGIEAIAGKAKYFTVYGPGTGTRWKNFLQAFCLASSGMEEEVIKSASQTFSILHHWFNNAPLKLLQDES
ncbi:MAG: biliverdin-producing heme oxygenase [Chitinophagaceae bacterium]|nr:biliverdin-producing heme oxygenase [Chitinophagaceae bacterium]